MNTKIRALVWEELRVGGVIAATCMAVGLIAQLFVRFGAFGVATGQVWRFVDSMALMATLGMPLLAALLLTLNAANSGQLVGGFSRRILHLPVDTRSAVLVALLTRIAEVLAVAAMMVATCRLLFDHGPGARVIVIVGAIYLLIQVLDWLRAVAALLVPLLVLAVLGILFAVLGGTSAWSKAMSAQDGVSVGLLAAFAVAVALAAVLSVMVVGWTRCGEQWSLFSVATLERVLSVGARQRRKPFASPLAAQTWFELKRSQPSLLVMTAAAWILANGVRWLIVYSLREQNQELRHHVSEMLSPFWLLEIMPFVALVLASFAWTSWTAWRSKAHKGRPTAFALRQPITQARMTQARLIAAGVNLAVALAVVTAAYAVSFLFSEDAQFGRIVWEALGRGETSIRELCGILLGPSIVFGLAAWIFIGNAKGMGTFWSILFLSVVVTIAVFGVLLESILSPLAEEILWSSVIWLALLLPPLLLTTELAVTYRRGFISRCALVVCVAVWAAVTVGLFPFSMGHTALSAFIGFVVCLALGALTVLPFTAIALDFSLASAGEAVPRQNPAQHRRGTPTGFSVGQAVGLIVLACAVAALAWIRWPAEPAWQAAWRAQGLPTNLDELNAWYTPVPDDQNLAIPYLAAAEKCRVLEERWEESMSDSEPPTASTDAESQEPAKGPLAHVPIVGSARVGRTEQVPVETWRAAKRYWNAVGAEVCGDLHAALQSGHTASRYPIDLGLGGDFEIDHMGQVRTITRQLSFEAWMASVEHRADAATDAVLDGLSVAASLDNEPTVIALLVRSALYGITLASLENTMNRTILSEGDLQRVDEGLRRAIEPKGELSLLERALVGDCVQSLDYTVNLLRTYFLQDSSRDMVRDVADPAGVLFYDILGIGAFERLSMIRMNDALRHDVRTGSGETSGHTSLFSEELWAQRRSFLHKPLLAMILYYPQSRLYETQWRSHTALEVARTAIAVERFRLAHGRLPERLEELVPEFIESVPADVWNGGKPLSYRIRDNGEFVVYSYGSDREDDFDAEDYEHLKPLEGDIIFTVAPPEIRDRPQVAPEVPAEDEDDGDA